MSCPYRCNFSNEQVEDVVRQRWVENRKKQTRHDVEDNNFEEIINFFEPPSFDENPVILHHGDDIEKWIMEMILRNG